MPELIVFLYYIGMSKRVLFISYPSNCSNANKLPCSINKIMAHHAFYPFKATSQSMTKQNQALSNPMVEHI